MPRRGSPNTGVTPHSSRRSTDLNHLTLLLMILPAPLSRRRALRTRSFIDEPCLAPPSRRRPAANESSKQRGERCRLSRSWQSVHATVGRAAEESDYSAVAGLWAVRHMNRSVSPHEEETGLGVAHDTALFPEVSIRFSRRPRPGRGGVGLGPSLLMWGSARRTRPGRMKKSPPPLSQRLRFDHRHHVRDIKKKRRRRLPLPRTPARPARRTAGVSDRLRRGQGSTGRLARAPSSARCGRATSEERPHRLAAHRRAPRSRKQSVFQPCDHVRQGGGA